MAGVKIGGVYYGMDIQTSMGIAHKLVMDSAIQVYQDDYDHINTIRAALECYETALLERLKNGN